MKNKLVIFSIILSICLFLVTIILWMRGFIATDTRQGSLASYGVFSMLVPISFFISLMFTAISILFLYKNLYLKFILVFISCTSLILIASLIVLEPNYNEWPILRTHAIYWGHWSDIQVLIDAEELNFLYIPEKESMYRQNPIEEEINAFAYENYIIMHYYTPVLIEMNPNGPYGDLTIVEFEEQMHDLAIYSLPTMLIVGQGEIQQLEFNNNHLIDEMQIQLVRISKIE